MYAVIRAGGRQIKVSEGDVIEVDRLRQSSGSIEFAPVLVVNDDGSAVSGREHLAGASVKGEVLGESKGPKLEVMKYRSKTGYRRHTGHRQRYTSVRIASINSTSAPPRRGRKKATEGSDQDGS
jgi:large subunit ribosomal protein L21